MFGGGDMSQMMKQLGMEMEELDAEKVEIDLGDRKLVFNSPEVSKVEAQGNEIFQLRGNYSEEDKGPSEEDIELVMEKTEASEDEAREALEDNDDVAGAVMELQ